MDWLELSPVLVGLALLAAHRRVGDLMVKRAVQFHSSAEHKWRAEGQRTLSRVVAAAAGLAFILLGLIDAFLLEDSTVGRPSAP